MLDLCRKKILTRKKKIQGLDDHNFVNGMQIHHVKSLQISNPSSRLGSSCSYAAYIQLCINRKIQRWWWKKSSRNCQPREGVKKKKRPGGVQKFQRNIDKYQKYRMADAGNFCQHRISIGETEVHRTDWTRWAFQIQLLEGKPARDSNISYPLKAEPEQSLIRGSLRILPWIYDQAIDQSTR